MYNFDSNRMDNINSNKQKDDSSDILEKLAGAMEIRAETLVK